MTEKGEVMYEGDGGLKVTRGEDFIICHVLEDLVSRAGKTELRSWGLCIMISEALFEPHCPL